MAEKRSSQDERILLMNASRWIKRGRERGVIEIKLTEGDYLRMLATLSAHETTAKVIIACDGGLVQDVCASVPVEYAMIDYDVEGADEDRLTAIPQDDKTTVEAYAYAGNADVLPPERVQELFKAIIE